MASAKMIAGLGPRPKEPRFILENQYGVCIYMYTTGAVFDAHFQQSRGKERRPSTVTCKKENEDQTERRQEDISPRDEREDGS